MSDFDKEAEREKLREKFERDEEKRETTRQMSELLLKGATMTNRHCDTCGNPIFRYQGQEFCPTCSRQGGGQAAAGVPDQQTEVDTARKSLDVEAPDQGPDEAQQPPSQADGASEAASTQPADAGTAPQGPSASQQPAAGGQQAPAGQAAQALQQALVTAARKAAAADDPRQATEWLGAAREAAEALSTLSGR